MIQKIHYIGADEFSKNDADLTALDLARDLEDFETLFGSRQ